MRREILSMLAACLAAASTPCSAGPTTQPGVVDLIKLSDPHQATVFAGWTLADGVLVSAKQGPSRIEFPYVPPDEYDWRIVFTRSSGKGDFVCICRGGGRQFVWRMSGRSDAAAGFALVDGKSFGRNQTTKTGDWVLTGQQEELLIQVRRDRVQVIIDGVPVSSLVTDYHNLSLSPPWALSRKDTIGLHVYANDLTIESAEIIEISGPGQPLR